MGERAGLKGLRHRAGRAACRGGVTEAGGRSETSPAKVRQVQFNVHPQVAQAISRFTAVNDALKTLAGDNRQVYLHELRKLCLAVQAADEVRRALRRAGAPQQQGLLAREATQQVMCFAYLRELPQPVVEEATRAAEEGYPASQQANPSLSRAGLLMQELRQRAGDLPEEKLHNGLAVQPLTAVLAEQSALIQELEPVYPFCVDYSYQVLYQTAREIEGLGLADPG